MHEVTERGELTPLESVGTHRAESRQAGNGRSDRPIGALISRHRRLACSLPRPLAASLADGALSSGRP